MSMQKKVSGTYEMDMCSGPIFSKIIAFALPLMVSGVLQLLFNAADIIVVGRFAGSESLAAVGATTSLINLLVNVFIGLSIGVNVLVAQFYGARKWRELEETVHTSIMMALGCGLLLLVLGELVSGFMLRLMGTPEDVFPLSNLYLKIFFIGTPATLVYNFGSAILRAAGDTKRPMMFLLFAGVVNVVLNLIFVIVFAMGVAGVALATIISQYISAVLIMRCLMATDASYKVCMNKLRMNPARAAAILRVGLPAGFQSAMFNISNVLIQSSLNSFGSVAMAGSTASSNIEGFVYTAMNAFYQSALSFISQNYGAGQFKRITKIMWYCLGLVTLSGVILGGGAVLAGRELIGIYSSDPTVIEYGMQRLIIVSGTYFICGLMDTMVGVLRGMGSSVAPTIISLTGVCALRILWLFTVFAANRTIQTLYLAYPFTWTVTLIANIICYRIIRRKAEQRRGANITE